MRLNASARWLIAFFASGISAKVWSLPSGTLEPARLKLLADALEDAGCTDPVPLAHCRSRTEHVRGCWLVDRLRAAPQA